MKKVKLFTTIASLCLAVALMAFGVYAATSVSVTVSGNVSFVAQAHVNATVTITDSLNENGSVKTGALVGAEAKTLYDTKANTSDATDSGAQAYGDLVFEAADTSVNVVFTYIVSVTNKASADDTFETLTVTVDASAFAEPTDLAKDGYTIEIAGDLAAGTVEVAPGATKTYTVTFTLNPNVTVENADFTTVITLGMIDKQAGV